MITHYPQHHSTTAPAKPRRDPERKQYENLERSEKSWNKKVLRDESGTVRADLVFVKKFSSFCLLFMWVKYKHYSLF